MTIFPLSEQSMQDIDFINARDDSKKNCVRKLLSLEALCQFIS